jgi:hypothetical protein
MKDYKKEAYMENSTPRLCFIFAKFKQHTKGKRISLINSLKEDIDFIP